MNNLVTITPRTTSEKLFIILFKLFSDTPFGSLPMLEVNGYKLGESSAIARFVARIGSNYIFLDFCFDIWHCQAHYLIYVDGFRDWSSKSRPSFCKNPQENFNKHDAIS